MSQKPQVFNSEFVVKALIVVFIAFIRQVIFTSRDEDFLKWVRNRLGDPVADINNTVLELEKEKRQTFRLQKEQTAK